MTQRTEDRTAFLTRLPTEEHEALRNLAHFTRRSMNEIVTEAVRQYLATEGRRQHLAAVVESGRDDMRVLLDKLADS